MKNIFNILSWITLVSSFSLILLIGYWELYPYTVIKSYYPHQVLTPIVKAGEALKYRRIVTKYMDIQGTIACSIIDGIEYKLPTRTSKTELGLNDSIQLLIIPSQIEAGIYKYSCEITFKVNPIREITYHTETEKFQVINDEK